MYVGCMQAKLINQKRNERYLKRTKKLTNVVENSIHNITKEIVMTNPKGVVMEDLDVNKMKSKNHFIASEIHDYSFGKCKQIMKEKCNNYNIPFKVAPRDYPSSQLCSNCGHKYDIDRHSRKYKCPVCGHIEDRDINAAKNLANLFDKL